MSRTTLYAAGTDGDLLPRHEFQNAWLSAMLVWDEFGKRYCGFDPRTCLLLEEDKLRQVWDLNHSDAVPEADRVTLSTTFDRALVRGPHLLYVADCMEQTARWLPAHSTIGAQAQALREIAAEGVRAVGWQQTSVAEDLWWIYGADEEEGRPWNLDRDTGAWEMFEAEENEAKEA